MKLQVVGCSHHETPIELREQLAFREAEVPGVLRQLRDRFPNSEAVLLSTCNRVELYVAGQDSQGSPGRDEVVQFLAEYHGLSAHDVFDDLFTRSGVDAVRHLFTVAASLDSLVVGEAQILSQVKQAYELASRGDSTGPVTHAAFQAAIRAAKRVARETTIHERRVSVPSVAITDFASQIFERFDDKQVLVVGAGEMGSETLRYLVDQGAKDINVVNRDAERARKLAAQFGGRAVPWHMLLELLATADLVISTTGAAQPIVTLADFKKIQKRLNQRALCILDLAVPRDFDPDIGQSLGVYLYSIDDLKKTCQINRKAREQEWPKAQRILEEETAQFMADLHHRATGPTIQRLKARANQLKDEEVTRLLKKLNNTDQQSHEEIQRSFDRLIKKLLHPPLESLRDEARKGTPHGLLDALKKLFQLKD